MFIGREKQLQDLLSFIKVNKIGFVALSGFDFTSAEHELLTGDDLYN